MEEITLLLAQQSAEMKESMDTLLRQIHSQMAAYSTAPTDFGDTNPGPSNRGRRTTPVPPDPAGKQSASTPRNDKGKGVDRGGGNQEPPRSPPRNTGGDPDPDDDDDDDDDGEDDRGRKGGRPARAPRRPSIPRDTSPKTRAILTFMESLAIPNRPTKLIAEPPYFFQGEDNQDVRNWLTACEDYFDRNPTKWENHTHRIVFALKKEKQAQTLSYLILPSS